MKTPLLGSNIALVSNAVGSGTSYSNTVSGLTATDVQAAIDELVTGITGTYLTVVGGGRGTVQAHGNLGATETIDLATGNYHWGTLNANCTIDFTGWTNLKDCQITLELIEDGTGGHTPTFTGVTWIGGTTPTHDTTAGTTTLYAFLSRDGGTTIYGAMVAAGGAASTGGMVPYYIAPGDTFTVPLYKQALFEMPIDIAAGGSLVIDGFLIAVT